MKNLAIFIALALVFLTSCAQVPKQAAYPLSYQYKMQAGEHWNKLAKEVAEKVKSNIRNPNDAIFISDSDLSPFSRAMRTLLTTALQEDCLNPNLVDKNSPYRLVWEVQQVSHYADRRNGFGGWPAFILLDIPQSIFLGETDCAFRTKPHSEVIVNFELLKIEGTNQPSLRHTRIFYVNDEDFYNHYSFIYNPYSIIPYVVTSGLGSVKYTMTTHFEAIKVP